MNELNKEVIESEITNSLTERDCEVWASGKLTAHVKGLIKKYHIREMNIWDDICEIVSFEEPEEKETTVYFFAYESTDGIFNAGNGYLAYEGMFCRHRHPIMGPGNYLHKHVLHSYKRNEIEHDLRLAVERGKLKSMPEIRQAKKSEDISFSDFFRSIKDDYLPIVKISKFTLKAI
jgi:beta-galactosidase/beta-glucuronidase